MGIGNSTRTTAVFRLPLLRSCWAFGQFPFKTKEIFKEIIAPLAQNNVLSGKAGSRRVIQDRQGHIVEDLEAVKVPQAASILDKGPNSPKTFTRRDLGF